MRDGFVEVPENALPVGGELRRLTAWDGLELRTAVWRSPAAPIKGTVLLLSGRTEFIEKYGEVIGEFLGRGYAVATFDWRGQGLSGRLCADPRKGHVEDFSDYLRDLEQALDTVFADLPEPLLVFGHSMGGLVALSLLQETERRVSAAILSAPMTGILAPGSAPPAALRALAKLMTGLGLGQSYTFAGKGVDLREEAFTDNVVTSCERRHARAQALCAAEPDILLGGVTWGWLAAALDRIGTAMRPEMLARVDCPVLILTAGREKLVDNDSHAALARDLPDARQRVFPDAAHEVLMETDDLRARTWADIDAFLNEVASGRTAEDRADSSVS